MARYYVIEGYWKDDKSEFSGLVVKSTEDIIEKEDDDIFFYGLGKDDLEEAIKLGENTSHEFVITGYKRVTKKDIW